MIRINLLPFRAARKRENIRRQVSISGLLFLLFILLLAVWFIHLNGKLLNLKNEESSKKTELAGYQKELNEIKKLEKDIKEINTKLSVIKDLEKGKTGPVLLLSTIADAVPKDKLWLTSLNEGNGKLTLTGTAMDNETVALFMNNLAAAKDVITSVELKSAIGKDIKEYNLKVSDFSLECRTYAYKEETKAAAAGNKKGK
ncbi:MAG: PilN domain-containing protein [Deltaproteobacteria bacterium]|nr:PilN domain-containing protein [Deltaproteobacteria bacterium]